METDDVVTEVDESTNQEVVDQEDSTETEISEEVAEETEPSYTADEIKEIGISKLDPKRIPAELVPFYKSMLSDYTKKTQAVAEEKKRIEEAKQPAPQKPVEQKTLYEHYEDNPKAVTDWINGEIARLTNEDPYENALQIENLRDQKAELKLYGQQRQVTKQNTYIAELNKAIPNITDRAPELIQFAQAELGYTPEDLNSLTNPNLVGEAMAIKNTKMLNRLYEAAHPKGKEAPVKRITQAPAPINPVGGKSNTEPDPSKMSDEEWHAYENARLRKQGRLY